MLTTSGAQSFIPKVFAGEGAGHQISKGDHARLSSFIGAIAIADLVKTTLGPRGMDKMLVSGAPAGHGGGNVTVTNDGATILKKIPVDNPAAKILVNISMAQDDEIGDGTTSVVVLAGELLREAEKLVLMLKLHPQIIIRGWRRALVVATQALEDSTVDNRANPKLFEQDLLNIARTTLSSKIVHAELEFFSRLCVDAVLRLKGSIDLDMIQIIKKQGGSMVDSFLADGFILDKTFGLSQKAQWTQPVIMLANTGMDTDKIKIWGARVRVHSMAEVADIEHAEKQKMKRKVEKILGHHIDIFINRQLIYDYPEQLFRDHGVSSIEHADFDGVERLARVLGCDIMSNFDDPSSTVVNTKNNNNNHNNANSDESKANNTEEQSNNNNNNESTKTDANTNAETNASSTADTDTVVAAPAAEAAADTVAVAAVAAAEEKKETAAAEDPHPQRMAKKVTLLGTCAAVEEIMIGEDKVIKFSGVSIGEACTIVLRGASSHLLDEMERSIHDALCILTQTIGESRIVWGGGASEMVMSRAVELEAAQTSGKESIAMDAFARALRSIPNILADNAGFDAAEIVSNLRSAHSNGQSTMGVDMLNGAIGDMQAAGVTESYKSKLQSTVSAHEAAEMILRVDDIVKCAPRARQARH